MISIFVVIDSQDVCIPSVTDHEADMKKFRKAGMTAGFSF